MFDKILVVCVGNICRSPTGEYLLKRLLPGKKIISAGVAALVGMPAEKMASLVAQENRLSLQGHKAQQLTAELCDECDLILVMEQSYINYVSDIAPQARGKTMLFGHWVNNLDVPDPYRQDKAAFEYAYQLIEKAALAWAERL